jgi:hypothetical protein
MGQGCGTRNKMSDARDSFWARKGLHWNPLKVLAEIRRWKYKRETHRESYVPLNLMQAGRRYFGSWRKAIEKAGFNYEDATDKVVWNRYMAFGYQPMPPIVPVQCVLVKKAGLNVARIRIRGVDSTRTRPPMDHGRFDWTDGLPLPSGNEIALRCQ